MHMRHAHSVLAGAPLEQSYEGQPGCGTSTSAPRRRSPLAPTLAADSELTPDGVTLQRAVASTTTILQASAILSGQLLQGHREPPETPVSLFHARFLSLDTPHARTRDEKVRPARFPETGTARGAMGECYATPRSRADVRTTAPNAAKCEKLTALSAK